MSAENPALETEDELKVVEPDLNKTTDEATVTKTDDQLPGQDDKIIDDPDKDKTKSEELAADDEDKESQFVEIDGEEIDLNDIKQWRDNGLMQSDYTKKTTEHSQFAKKEREEIALERETLSKTNADVSGMRDLLTVLVAEDEVIDWAELKEIDPEEYIRLKEIADQRKDALTKVKAERETPADDPAFIESERKKFWDSHPEWLDKDNKVTDVCKADTALMNDYVAKSGYTPEEFNKLTSSKQLTTILKAAKFDELQEKGRKIKEKRVKIPVVTKPKVNSSSQAKTAGAIFFPNAPG